MGAVAAGKTTLLVALVLFLRGVAGAGGSGDGGRPAARPRVLVAAHTNAAVDNILLGIAAAGFDGGATALPTLQRRMLLHTVHCTHRKCSISLEEEASSRACNLC